MGMDPDIIAVGPFSDAVASVLDYPAHLYDKTLPGTPIVVELFELMISGSPTGSTFALHLGITDAWDFNQHVVIPSRIDYVGVQRLLETRGVYRDDCLRELHRLRMLAANGFTLYFRPNG